MSPIRVLLADDQALVRSGFALMLSVEDDIEVVGQAATGREAIELASALDPDVILMDAQMPVLDGIRATAEFVEAGLGKVVILTTFERDDYLFTSLRLCGFAALRAGASGFLLETADPDDLVTAVHAVATGHALLAPELTMRLIERFVRGSHTAGATETTTPGRAPDQTPMSGHTPVAAAGPASDVFRTGTVNPERRQRLERLTGREREVLQHMAAGHSNSEIAAILFLGETMVKTHVSNLLAKLALRDRVQAVVFAHRAGLIHTEEE